jgi:hypothetical protein
MRHAAELTRLMRGTRGEAARTHCFADGTQPQRLVRPTVAQCRRVVVASVRDGYEQERPRLTPTIVGDASRAYPFLNRSTFVITSL